MREFKTRTIRSAREEGYVTTLSGRRRSFPDLHLQGDGTGFKRAYAERQAVNFVIQGSAADFIKTAMKDIATELTLTSLTDKCRCCLQIHDELVFEVEPTVLDQCAALIAKCMTECAQLRVPMRVKAQVGRRWGDLVALEDAQTHLSAGPLAPAPVPTQASCVSQVATSGASEEAGIGDLAPAHGSACHSVIDAEVGQPSDGDVRMQSECAVAGRMPSTMDSGVHGMDGSGGSHAETVREDELAADGRWAGAGSRCGGDRELEEAGGSATACRTEESPPQQLAGAGVSSQSAQGSGFLGGRDDDDGEGDATRKKHRSNAIEAIFDFDFGKHSGSQSSKHAAPQVLPTSQAPITERQGPQGGQRSSETLAITQPDVGSDKELSLCGARQPSQQQWAGAKESMPAVESPGHQFSFQSVSQQHGSSAGVPLREIALSGLNLNPLRANRLVRSIGGGRGCCIFLVCALVSLTSFPSINSSQVGGPMQSKFHAQSSLSAALYDDDTDQLDLD